MTTTTVQLAKQVVAMRGLRATYTARRVLADAQCPVCTRPMYEGTYAFRGPGKAARYMCQTCAQAPTMSAAKKAANARLRDMLTMRRREHALGTVDTPVCWVYHRHGRACADCGERADKLYAKCDTSDVTRNVRRCILCLERRYKIDQRNVGAAAMRKADADHS